MNQFEYQTTQANFDYGIRCPSPIVPPSNDSPWKLVGSNMIRQVTSMGIAEQRVMVYWFWEREIRKKRVPIPLEPSSQETKL